LKAFLQFAEKGNLSVRPEDVQENFNKQHLSASISKKLKEKGLNVTCNIGTSNFKVDIGIVHPDKPQQYILGIVVDGHYYYNTHTANDREMIMPSMLKALGWNIHRIWTIDWLENSDKIIDTIIEKVKQLQSNLDVKSESMDEPAVERAFESIKLMPDVVLPINVVSKQISYTACTITPISNANSETIYDLQNRNFIKQQIKYLVDTESPISKSLLYKKVLQAWNTSRAGAKLDNHLEGIIKEMNLVKTTHHQLFFWSNNTALDYYRRNDIEKRNIEDIAPEEVLVALQEVVVNNLSIKEDELFRYLARTFGFAKIGSQIDTILRYVIDTAVQNGKVMKENDRIKLADK
jgi:hypothetical protein